MANKFTTGLTVAAQLVAQTMLATSGNATERDLSFLLEPGALKEASVFTTEKADACLQELNVAPKTYQDKIFAHVFGMHCFHDSNVCYVGNPGASSLTKSLNTGREMLEFREAAQRITVITNSGGEITTLVVVPTHDGASINDVKIIEGKPNINLDKVDVLTRDQKASITEWLDFGLRKGCQPAITQLQPAPNNLG